MEMGFDSLADPHSPLSSSSRPVTAPNHSFAFSPSTRLPGLSHTAPFSLAVKEQRSRELLRKQEAARVAKVEDQRRIKFAKQARIKADFQRKEEHLRWNLSQKMNKEQRVVAARRKQEQESLQWKAHQKQMNRTLVLEKDAQIQAMRQAERQYKSFSKSMSAKVLLDEKCRRHAEWVGANRHEQALKHEQIEIAEREKKERAERVLEERGALESQQVEIRRSTDLAEGRARADARAARVEEVLLADMKLQEQKRHAIQRDLLRKDALVAEHHRQRTATHEEAVKTKQLTWAERQALIRSQMKEREERKRQEWKEDMLKKKTMVKAKRLARLDAALRKKEAKNARIRQVLLKDKVLQENRILALTGETWDIHLSSCLDY